MSENNENIKSEHENPVSPMDIQKREKKAASVKREYLADSGDKLLAAAIFVLAILAVEFFGLFTIPDYYGRGVAVFAFLYAGCIILYAKRKGRRIPAEGYFWLAVMVLCALSYQFVYHQSLKWFHPLFLRLTAMYAVMVTMHALIKGKSSEWILFDGMNMLFLIPFGHIKAQWSIVWRESLKTKHISKALKGFLGLVAAVPLLAVIIKLLSAADSQFQALFINGMSLLGNDFDRMFWTVVSSLPAGCYLYGLFYGTAYKQDTAEMEGSNISKIHRACAVIPAVSLYTVLFAICGIYILFIGIQGSYYLGALQGILPVEFTYSEYARQGFFELVKISFINLCIQGVTQLCCKEKKAVLNVFQILLSVLTLFIIATAITKMMLYIQAYGLTPLRVIPSVFMIFLAFVFILLIVSRIQKIPVIKISLLIFALGYTWLSLVNMDGRIAQYNLERYRTGTLSEFPKQVLIMGSLASASAMYDVWEETEDKHLRENISETARSIQSETQGIVEVSNTWHYGSFEKDKAAKYIDIMAQ